MDKNIDKERAIQLLVGFRNYLTSGNPIWDIDDVSKAFDMAIKSLERKRGEWIVDDASIEHCSACKHRFYISALFAVGGNDEPPCCPNCGAEMRKGESNG